MITDSGGILPQCRYSDAAVFWPGDVWLADVAFTFVKRRRSRTVPRESDSQKFESPQQANHVNWRGSLLSVLNQGK